MHEKQAVEEAHAAKTDELATEQHAHEETRQQQKAQAIEGAKSKKFLLDTIENHRQTIGTHLKQNRTLQAELNVAHEVNRHANTHVESLQGSMKEQLDDLHACEMERVR